MEGSNGTEVDLIGPNRNSLIFRENKLSSINFREKIIHYITVGSQIVAHTQMETGDGSNKPNITNL